MTWKRVYPFEIAALLAVAAAVVFLRAHGLRIDWSTVRYTIPPMLRPTGVALLAGIPLQLLYRALLRRPLRPYLRRIASWEWLSLWLRLWIAYMAVTYAYFWLKVSVPLVNPRLFDGALWQIDRLLHLGVSPSIFATTLLAGTPLLGFLDTWYGWWLPSIFYGVAFFSASDDALFRRRLMLSSVLIWGLGAWIYTAVPAIGPCYASPDVFAATKAATPKAVAAQGALLENYRLVVAGREGGALRSFNPTRGVAALPSLHVGLHWLLFLWAWSKEREQRVVWLIATGLTFLASVATGWHYALDGYAGIALAQLCWWLARRLEPSPPAPAAAADSGTAATAPAA